MKTLRLVISLICFIQLLSSYAQNSGTIRGKVVEDATGEELIGVTVVIKGTSNGSITDLEGTYQIKTEPGIYDVQISFVSFETVVVSGVEVNEGEVTVLDYVRLKESVQELEAVTVTAEVLRDSEIALLTVKRKSANLLDGISSQTFKRIGDSDAAGAIRRVSGVSIQNGQYVFVRGLGDRYTKTVLSGLEIPGLDPDRNALQIDIFPTNIIDNIIVYKSFTPELSADFVGGTVDIQTKDFPEEKVLTVSASMEYNPSMHFNSDNLTYPGGGTDFLGIDDGSRELPIDASIFDIPSPSSTNTSANQEILESARRFDPTMGVTPQTSSPNYSLSVASGNQYDRGGYKLGYNAALNYSTNNAYFENAVDAFYIKANERNETELEADTRFEGPLSTADVQLSALLGTAVKWQNSKISIQGLHIQNGTERAAQRLRVRSNENFNTSVVDNLEYTERSLSNLLLDGLHFFSDGKAELSWKASYTSAQVNDLDVRITPFTQLEDGELAIRPSEGGEPNRIWRLLDEQNYVARVDFTKEISFLGNGSKISAGASNIYKTRDFQIQDFFLTIRGANGLTIDGDPNRLLIDENLIDPQSGLGVAIQDRFVASNAFSGRINISGAYLSSELGLTQKLKGIFGVRVENYDQFYTGQNQEALTGSPAGRTFDDENVLSSLKFFPSANLIYAVQDNSNLRASYYRTIARPSFKELSTAEIQDVLTGRTFIGNIDLVETDIDNFDLRYEVFLGGGQTISVGAFYKMFTNPIELVRQPLQPIDIKPTNVGDARIIGAEFEIRKNLEFISPALANFSFNGNFTWTNATVAIDSAERAGRIEGMRGEEVLMTRRDFLGQPPYIINAGLNYDLTDQAFEAALTYNVQAPTLAVVGINRSPDTYDVEFHSLNLNLSKGFGAEFRNELGLRVTNILNDVREREFRAFGSSSYIESSRMPGTAIRVRYSRKF